ncbi:hypothetical protein B0O80DRAFT_500707 [Mortierella sp. GBAus27b]|nr:hypothetical protein BGX31_008429 [Mortierella sp. GBA43]KAI8350515.1 hypothetical protein B0O80DRAFT_500707 [Mortierella sp. GBAus27b]
MNHETKEVILKATEVVKTVVHFGFIPFVIYLGFTRAKRTRSKDESAGIVTSRGTPSPTVLRLRATCITIKETRFKQPQPEPAESSNRRECYPAIRDAGHELCLELQR